MSVKNDLLDIKNDISLINKVIIKQNERSKNSVKSLRLYTKNYMEKRKRLKILNDKRLRDVETTSEARSILYSINKK